MASIPKPTAVATAAPVHSARAVGPSARVASISTSQVDALENGTNISFDAAASGFQHEQNHSQLSGDGGQRRQYPDPGFDRLFTASSQDFASIFEEHGKNHTVGQRDQEATPHVGRPISSVIKTYETNALVISGQQPLNGVEFSFNL